MRAQSPEEIAALITSPVDGQQLFGLVNITGSASASDARSTTTRWNTTIRAIRTASWMLVQPPWQQQRQNDILGTWNTNMVPDGVYRLRLRVFLTDGQVSGEFVVSNLRVVNSEPTPVPTTAAGGIGNVAERADARPVPTSPIEQPPSSNPSSRRDIRAGCTGDQASGPCT